MTECVGNTCGNVSCMLAYLGVQTYCDKDLLSVAKMTVEEVRECLQKASETASRSVSYLSSKGMVDEIMEEL